MDQEKIGRFMAALRKEKKLTQEQLAERLGVTNRSVSRWETGYCMPDLSLLQSISEELEVSVAELLNGAPMEEQENEKLKDSIDTLIQWANKESRRKAKKLNQNLLAESICFIVAVLHVRFRLLTYIVQAGDLATGILTSLGLLFGLLGIYNNRQNHSLTQRELELLSGFGKEVQMKTTQEMLQFAGKYQEVTCKPYKLAFNEIEKALEEGENVSYAIAGSAYANNELPMMWYTVLAATENRILIAGQRMKGMIVVRYMVESIPYADITAIRVQNSILMIKTSKNERKIEIKDSDAAKKIQKELREYAAVG